MASRMSFSERPYSFWADTWLSVPPMSNNSRNRRHFVSVSRRQFLGGAGAGCLSLLSGVSPSASDENLAPPQFLLAWGHHGTGDGEFSVCVGIAIGKND